MKKYKFLLYVTLIIITSCHTESEEKDMTASNFINWAKQNKRQYREYLVMGFNGCSSCHHQMVKLIKDGYLKLNRDKAIVLIISEKSELYPIADFIDNPNLYIYDYWKLKKNIIGKFPRVYYQSKKGKFKQKTLNITQFEKKLKSMTNKIVTLLIRKEVLGAFIDAEMLSGISIPGSLGFISLTDKGNSNFDVKYDNHIVKALYNHD